MRNSKRMEIFFFQASTYSTVGKKKLSMLSPRALLLGGHRGIWLWLPWSCEIPLIPLGLPPLPFNSRLQCQGCYAISLHLLQHSTFLEGGGGFRNEEITFGKRQRLIKKLKKTFFFFGIEKHTRSKGTRKTYGNGHNSHVKFLTLGQHLSP